MFWYRAILFIFGRIWIGEFIGFALSSILLALKRLDCSTNFPIQDDLISYVSQPSFACSRNMHFTRTNMMVSAKPVSHARTWFTIDTHICSHAPPDYVILRKTILISLQNGRRFVSVYVRFINFIQRSLGTNLNSRELSDIMHDVSFIFFLQYEI